MLKIIDKRKYMYFFSGTLVLISLFSIFIWGLKLGIDFKGGTLMEVQFSAVDDAQQISDPNATEEKKTGEVRIPTTQEMQDKLAPLNLDSLVIQSTGESGAILRYIASNEDLNEKVMVSLRELNKNTKQLRVDFVGASVSNEIKNKAITSVFLGIIGIALYIAWAFRKVSYPVSSWQYGSMAVVALFHDILITVGVFSLLGRFMGVEIGVSFVAAILTILGYSINDTIVVYDRTRENLMRSNLKKENFEQIVDRSLNETLARSINTTLTVIIVLVAIFFFGGASLKDFSLALLVGISFGAYSSIFVASALLVSSYHFQLKQMKK